ncbi:MAG: MerC domain-containing protein [Pseudomonadota bacterium]
MESETTTIEHTGPSRWWDIGAAGLSFACILHCLGMPVVIALLPMFGQFADSHFVHMLLVFMAAPITLRVIWGEGLRGRAGRFAAFALFGLALMFAAVLIEPLEAHEVILTMIGGTFLGGAHIWRWFGHHSPPAVEPGP